MTHTDIHKTIKAIIMDYADDLYSDVGDPDPDKATARIMAMFAPKVSPEALEWADEEISKIESGEYAGVKSRPILESRHEVVQAGWKLVPLEPTHDTIRAIFEWLADNDMPNVEYEYAETLYRVALAAAPEYGEEMMPKLNYDSFYYDLSNGADLSIFVCRTNNASAPLPEMSSSKELSEEFKQKLYRERIFGGDWSMRAKYGETE